MRHEAYDPADARALAPLLSAVSREIEERTLTLVSLERRLEQLRASPFYSADVPLLEAEAATHRRELRHCREELDRLGCRVVGENPLTIRIPTREAGTNRSLVWQRGNAPRP